MIGKPVRIMDFKELRYTNLGFSRGENMKNQILQMAVLKPKLVILDGANSWLDVDALRIVSQGVKAQITKENSILIITHNNRILKSLDVDYIHILTEGKIIRTSDYILAMEIETNGYFKALSS